MDFNTTGRCLGMASRCLPDPRQQLSLYSVPSTGRGDLRLKSRVTTFQLGFGRLDGLSAKTSWALRFPFSFPPWSLRGGPSLHSQVQDIVGRLVPVAHLPSQESYLGNRQGTRWTPACPLPRVICMNLMLPYETGIVPWRGEDPGASTPTVDKDMKRSHNSMNDV